MNNNLIADVNIPIIDFMIDAILKEKALLAIKKLQGFELSSEQIECIDALFRAFNKFGIIRKRQMAYILATAYHEAARKEKSGDRIVFRRIVCVEEIGKGKGKRYGKKIKYSGKPYSFPDKIYFGRGLVQITWYELYERLGKKLGLDLINYPEIALTPNVAAEIAVLGMRDGLFTGVSLEKYFNDTKTDPINARKIINSLDNAKNIEKYYKFIISYL